MTHSTTLLLASTSAHRRALLGRLGLPFGCVDPRVPEPEIPGEAPVERAARLAQAKCGAVAALHPAAVVIGGDQVASVTRQGTGALLLHKPGDRATCAVQLAMMSGNIVQFHTAVVVQQGASQLSHVDLTQVRFRHLSATQIESYMDREPSFDCAGGFKCEGLGVTLFESIETRDPTALVGLPLIWLCEALRQRGFAV